MIEVNREVARKLGISKYTPSHPCGNGHSTFRYTKSNRCVTCSIASKLGMKPRLLSSRAEAMAAGHIRWMPATPCANGHHAPRRVASNKCVECCRKRVYEGREIKIRITSPLVEGPLREYAKKLNLLLGGGV